MNLKVYLEAVKINQLDDFFNNQLPRNLKQLYENLQTTVRVLVKTI